jgi:cyclo(L-tyrosyl-L-tyrosyl) synthase
MIAEASGFVCEPLSDTCRRIRARGQHVLVGVSPGNSYFSEDNLTKLLGWAAREFRRVAVIIPDSALVATLLAAGYSPDRATKRSRETCARLRNRVLRAWDATGCDTAGRFELYLLSELACHTRYQALLRSAEEWLASDSALRACCLRLSHAVLSSYLQGVEPTTEQLAQALKYLLAEMPLLMDSPSIFGVESSTAVYHQRVDYIDALYQDRRATRVSESQGFAVVRPAETFSRTHALSSEA